VFGAQVTGFFVVESFVARVTDGLVTPAQGLVLWDVALRSLKQQLERAMESLRSAQQMLLVKDFVILVCVALERAGYQVGHRGRAMEYVWRPCGEVRVLLSIVQGASLLAA
jgi:hypothetical protein